VIEGIYQITFRGAADWGMGMLVLKEGTITGADVGGILYDGTYSDRDDNIEVNITLTVPAGATLVQGTPPRPTEQKVPFTASFRKPDIENRQPILVVLPPGPVNVIFNRLRKL